VALDSLGDLTMGIEGAEGRQEAALWLLRRLRAQGATTLYTQRLSRAVGPNPLSEIEGPELADTIIYLGLVEIESRLEKVISVLKHRGAPAEGDLRSVSYTDRGLEVSERFIGLTGVLAGTALGQRKAQIENVFQPLYFIRDFLTLAKDPSLEPGRREQLLKNLSSQTEKVIGVLGRYFDEPTRKGAGEASKQGP
jgi:circadian clock protein KaiC